MPLFTCLMYHSLSDGRWPDGQYLKYTTTKCRFGDHLDRLRGEGFAIESFADLRRRLTGGGALPERYCLMTCDDGHKSSLEMAEALSDHGANGTFFLTKQYCRERAEFCDDAAIREIAGRGFDVGTHGVTHRSLAHMPADEMRTELDASKKWLEDVVQKEVTSMSLPAGQGSTDVTEAAFALGYQLVGDSLEVANGPAPCPRHVHRFCVLAKHGAGDVQAMAAGSRWYSLKRAVRARVLSVPKRLLQTYNKQR